MIRRATAADAATLADLGRRTFIDTFAAMNRAEDIDHYVARTYGEQLQLREIASPSGATLIAEQNGVAAGFAQLQRSHAPAGLDRPIELGRFYVDRPWHGQGIAQALMRAVEEEARRMGAATLWLGVWEHNARAIAFYTRCGFRDIGSHPFLLGSDLQTDREMAKDLTVSAATLSARTPRRA